MLYVVEPNYAGWRLERYLREKLRRASRERVLGIIQRGVFCDEGRLKPSTPVYPGLAFRLRRPASEEPETPTDVAVVFQDDWLLVLDKPAGLPIHPTARYHKGTLVSLLRERFEERAAEPAHRLDRETSGLVVCGRTTESCRVLGRLFLSRDVHKEYLAVCEGHPREDAFVVDAPIAEGTDLIRIAVRIDSVEGKESRTRFEVVQRFTRDGAPFALLRCYPETGRQHQIRIHLREAGHPLVGDKMYGPDPGYFDRFSKRCLEPEAWVRLRLPRHALHAARISFAHPGTRVAMTFEAPLPEDLEDFIAGRPLPEPPTSGA
ncbi:RluA family pseudouridine synthase [Corallococcus sp. H22C18031201]|uniref:RluA family pseudouridine synthase n=1 Tax=Citreicoccus inhibens TaxID=2849499 RepID=UPI000E73F410|nr:RluA family pseudouridine synthase [Citreicoccus inhibens]MBU8896271.1 RluA family pseudouridine synthase [Citreicoccus inhibens]RJS17470.1 RluA family pseudouridine synthase [Corallococcus sp. H22C18031201]